MERHIKLLRLTAQAALLCRTGWWLDITQIKKMWRVNSVPAVFLVFIAASISVCEGDYCTYYYQCARTCYRSSKYYTSCGWLGWDSCSRYSSSAYTCYTSCSERRCCPGYRGSVCTDAICDGANACLNEGRCVAPNTCSCMPGFGGSTCTDINECSAGTHTCEHICTNTLGSYRCSCRQGYQLSYDGASCTDIDECMTNNGGCAHTCTNTIGSFTCGCNDGYQLDRDLRTCGDVDECLSGTNQCNQICNNTVGSYSCSCHSGYYLGLDDRTCFDINECIQDPYPCQQECVNLPGTFRCECSAGYYLNATDAICYDIDECAANNGGCSDTCVNVPGNYQCECPTGYILANDDMTCVDQDECDDGTSGCSQICNNTIGSYDCSCTFGFRLQNDSHTCENIDDCENVTCMNGATCRDGVGLYTCQCVNGFTGFHCEDDINECEYLNGGCQGNCTNTFGSFNCSCPEPGYLHENGLLCIGVFEKHGLTDELLPVGDYIYAPDIPSLNDAVYSSTSKWYKLLSDRNIVYTTGIVHVEAGGTKLPLSIAGVELDASRVLSVISTRTTYSDTDGIESYTLRRPNQTIDTTIRDSDLSTFILSNSFARSYFHGLQSLLPDWFSLYSPTGQLLPVTELSSSIMDGEDIQRNIYCHNTPSLAQKKYSVFILSVDVAFNLFGDTSTIFLQSSNEKICIVTDIFQDSGTVFVTFPIKSITDTFKVFQSISDAIQKRSTSNPTGITIDKFRGFGLSLVKGIPVRYDPGEIDIWNGDHMVKYSVFDNADFWISGEVTLRNSFVKISVDAHMYASVPNPLKIFTDTFEDKWELLLDVMNSDGRILKFDFEIDDFIISIGGSEKRSQCGVHANPEGIFGSIRPKVHPFSHMPIIQDMFVEKLELFVLSGEYNNVYSESQVFEAVEVSLNTILQSIYTLMDEIVGCSQDSLAQNLMQLNTSIIDSIAEIEPFSASTANNIMQSIDPIKTSVMNLTASVDLTGDTCNLETFVSSTESTILSLLDDIKIQLTEMMLGSTTALTTALQNSDGYGLQYKGSLTLQITQELDWSFDLIQLEYVYSKANLGQCGRYSKVYELMEGEPAHRFYFQIYTGVLTVFFGFDHPGVGVAMNNETDKFIIQFSAVFAPFQKMGFIEGLLQVKVDVFISNERLFAFAESPFGIFYIQFEVAIELVGGNWNNLNLRMDARFVSPENRNVAQGYTRKRRSSDSNENMSRTLKNILTELINNVASFANDRIKDAQRLVSNVQLKIITVQDWLDDKRQLLHELQRKFDDAVAFLEDKKEDLENAKGIFYAASDAVKRAKEKVDRLCRLRVCGHICIPGIKCGWWYCRFKRCMFRIINPICVAYNVVCSAVRAVAHAALDATIALLHVPVVALDAAQIALSVAQVAVDKASSAVTFVEYGIDIAQIGLDALNVALEIAKKTLEGVKFLVATGFRVLSYIIANGLDNVIDVRNCRFSVETKRLILPIFDVACDIKPFNTNWMTVNIRVNFVNPLQSLWHVAKQLVDTILETFDIFGRRKREIGQMYMHEMHPVIRNIRDLDAQSLNNETDWDGMIAVLNNSRYGVHDFQSTDELREEQAAINQIKCRAFKNVHSFMSDAIVHLKTVNTEFMSALNDIQGVYHNFSAYDMDTFTNITYDDVGINETVAIDEFNMTAQYLNDTFQSLLDSFHNNSLILTMINAAQETQNAMLEQTNQLEAFDFLAEWTIAMNESINLYFNTTECTDLYDCLQYSLYTLNTLFIAEYDVETYNETIETLSSLEHTILQLFNTTVDIYFIQNASQSLFNDVALLNDLCRFCDEPPELVNDLVNVTAVIGKSIEFRCDVVGDHLSYQWTQNETLLAEEKDLNLAFKNLTKNHEAAYRCGASNVVGKISTKSAYLVLVDACPPGTNEVGGICVMCGVGSYQPMYGETQCIPCPDGYTTNVRGARWETQCYADNNHKDTTIVTIAVVVPSVVVLVAVIIIAFVVVKTSKRKLKVSPSDWYIHSDIAPYAQATVKSMPSKQTFSSDKLGLETSERFFWGSVDFPTSSHAPVGTQLASSSSNWNDVGNASALGSSVPYPDASYNDDPPPYK